MVQKYVQVTECLPYRTTIYTNQETSFQYILGSAIHGCIYLYYVSASTTEADQTVLKFPYTSTLPIRRRL